MIPDDCSRYDQPIQPPSIVRSAHDMGVAFTDLAQDYGADRQRREQLAREIGRRAVYETTQIDPRPWG